MLCLLSRIQPVGEHSLKQKLSMWISSRSLHRTRHPKQCSFLPLPPPGPPASPATVSPRGRIRNSPGGGPSPRQRKALRDRTLLPPNAFTSLLLASHLAPSHSLPESSFLPHRVNLGSQEPRYWIQRKCSGSPEHQGVGWRWDGLLLFCSWSLEADPELGT